MIGRGVNGVSATGNVRLEGQIQPVTKASGLPTIRKLLPIIWGWICIQQTARSNCKRLHVAESVSLGEKRFVAVVHVDGLQFLVGGSANSMALLAQLSTPEKFSKSIETAIDSTIPIPVLKGRRKRIAPKTVDQIWGNA
jgi:hypothetical protein